MRQKRMRDILIEKRGKDGTYLVVISQGDGQIGKWRFFEEAVSENRLIEFDVLLIKIPLLETSAIELRFG